MIPSKLWLGLAVFTVALAASSDPQANQAQDLAYRGNPVHPAIVRALLTDLADPLPTVAAIDLEGATRGNVCHAKVQERDGGWIYIGDSREDRSGWFMYRQLGVTPGGIHVVQTALSGGGSGVFCDLLFLKLEEQNETYQGKVRRQELLKRVGSYGLGDRDDGIVALEGRRVIVGPSKYRPKRVVITLN